MFKHMIHWLHGFKLGIEGSLGQIMAALYKLRPRVTTKCTKIK